MIDYHVHPDYSPDAVGTLAEFCSAATAAGLIEICFTTHYEPDPVRAEVEWVRVRGERRPVDSVWVTDYLAGIAECRAQFAPLVVLAGVEVGYEPGLEGAVSDFLKRHQFDFVLGAVHCLDHVSITAGNELERFRREYAQHGAGFVAARYLEFVRAAAGSQLFDCVAHLDIYRKYIRELFNDEFDLAIEASLDATLRSIAASGTGIEVNSSALRRGSAEPYPSSDFLRRAVAAGVQIFTTGSDAHRPADVGDGIDTVTAMLAGLGVVPARYRARRREPAPRPPGC